MARPEVLGHPTSPERIQAEFPEAEVFLEAARRFEAEMDASYQGNGRGVHPDTIDVILLKMASDAHPRIDFNQACDAYSSRRGFSPKNRGHLSYAIFIGYQPMPEYLQRCRQLAQEVQKEKGKENERKKEEEMKKNILKSLEERKAILFESAPRHVQRDVKVAEVILDAQKRGERMKYDAIAQAIGEEVNDAARLRIGSSVHRLHDTGVVDVSLRRSKEVATRDNTITALRSSNLPLSRKQIARKLQISGSTAGAAIRRIARREGVTLQAAPNKGIRGKFKEYMKEHEKKSPGTRPNLAHAARSCGGSETRIRTLYKQQYEKRKG